MDEKVYKYEGRNWEELKDALQEAVDSAQPAPPEVKAATEAYRKKHGKVPGITIDLRDGQARIGPTGTIFVELGVPAKAMGEDE